MIHPLQRGQRITAAWTRDVAKNGVSAVDGSLFLTAGRGGSAQAVNIDAIRKRCRRRQRRHTLVHTVSIQLSSAYQSHRWEYSGLLRRPNNLVDGVPTFSMVVTSSVVLFNLNELTNSETMFNRGNLIETPLGIHTVEPIPEGSFVSAWGPFGTDQTGGLYYLFDAPNPSTFECHE